MGKKMYYSEQEATAKLGMSMVQLQKLVADGKLRVFADGPRKMFKSDEIEALAEANPIPARMDESGEIQLTPADSTAHDAVAISVESSAGAKPPGKEDTVISSQGVSIFDEGDLEIEAADPMAKTTMGPSVEDQLSAAEGVGSGSGLLDLTREPDDTSLGAVLEDINVEGGVSGTGVSQALAEEPVLSEAEVSAPAAIEPTVLEAFDPTAGVFSGLAIASCIIMLLVAAVAVPAMLTPDVLPDFVGTLQSNLLVVFAVLAVVAIILAVVGFVTGKSTATRSAALTKK